MNLAGLINTLGGHLRQRYGAPVVKLPIDAGFTCPNRDGRVGRGGCSFCNNAAFIHGIDAQMTVPAQLNAGQARHAARSSSAAYYLAYFQAYTSTYGDLARLEALYRQALAVPRVIGLAVATRPDCVSAPVVDLLADLRDEGHEVWLELGLQSAHDATLARVNRGHGFAAYQTAVRMAERRGLALCTHLIAGLPGEGPAQLRASWAKVLALGVSGLKLHPLHVVRGTRLAAQWHRGEYSPWSLTDYAETAADLIEGTPAEVIWHRVSGTAPASHLLAPDWCAGRWPAINAIEAILRRRGTAQGQAGAAFVDHRSGQGWPNA